MVARIKKNDTVFVLSGKDKGSKGSIIEFLPKKGKVMVQGCNLVTRHVKARKANEVAGIKKQEAYLNACQVMPVCSACNMPCRVNVVQLPSGQAARACNRCKKTF